MQEASGDGGSGGSKGAEVRADADVWRALAKDIVDDGKRPVPWPVLRQRLAEATLELPGTGR